ncbi:acyltransferase [Rhizobium sp. TH2]|uniref:acyltransferase family protein n=1 Tax=Rhizobium sp. TH2 TaxID=2775403 RepID=UPI002158950F|nr:acyltransferase [Rhizobium sp. TH2]UVC11022.1 acyltransferase [Rhizobium sp. TH2]
MADSRHQLAFLDGLRGYASLWVLVGHAMFMTGYKIEIIAQPDMAVELFIIISGFLMTYHYQAREVREPWMEPDTWKIFWIRRFFRIAPLYYVCLALALYFGPELWQSRLDAATVLSGGVEEQARYASRYLDQSLTNILLHVSFLFGMTWTHNFQTPLPDWSIGLEMQYYAIFPFLMILALKLGRIAGMTLLVGVMAVVGAWLDRNGFVIGAYSILAMKFHLFAAGMLIAMTLRAEGKWKWLLIAGALAVIFVPLGGGRSALHRAIKIAIVLGFVALLYKDRLPALLKWPTEVLDRFLSNAPARFIGDVSYGVYLLHLVVMLPVCGWLAIQYPEMAPIPRLFASLALTVPITYGAAYLCYRFIEQPGISLGRKIASRYQKAPPPKGIPSENPA